VKVGTEDGCDHSPKKGRVNKGREDLIARKKKMQQSKKREKLPVCVARERHCGVTGKTIRTERRNRPNVGKKA